MSVHYGLEYKRAKARAQELHELLLQLDTAAEILYNNLKYDDVLLLIQKIEDVRFKYYNIVELKGKI